jgi:putative endonuclease
LRDIKFKSTAAARRPPVAAADPRRALGRRGEALAAEHLRRKGYRVLARNERTRHGEIDLIALAGSTLVFVEVKTRRASGGRGSPSRRESPLTGLRPLQRRRLRRLAAAWLSASAGARPRAAEIRFDAIGVLISSDGRPVAVEHLEAAW